MVLEPQESIVHYNLRAICDLLIIGWNWLKDKKYKSLQKSNEYIILDYEEWYNYSHLESQKVAQTYIILQALENIIWYHFGLVHWMT